MPEDISSSDGSMSYSTSAIMNILEKLKLQSVRETTKKNYYCVWRSFNRFIVHLDKKPTNWENRIQLFIGYSINSGKQSQMVRSYISAIKTILGFENISVHNDSLLLSTVTKACKLKNDQVKCRLPIHRDLLNIIIKNVKEFFQSNGQLYLAILYSALFSVGYYGMLRVGEMTTGSHPVLVTDVQVAENKRKMLFILRTSKTHNISDKL